MYTVARMTDEGEWLAIDSFESYSEAELNYDAYVDMYPNALVDIISQGE
jgi:hypothetical protein